jgi:hypothetical protein
MSKSRFSLIASLIGALVFGRPASAGEQVSDCH